MLFEVLIAIVLLVLGIILGRLSLNNESKYINLCLVILIVLFSWIGKDTNLIKIFGFQIRLTLSVQLVLLGILINRVLTSYISCNKNEG
jgi:hypothetical protein